MGDVKGGPAFTHISYNDYQIVYANLIEGKNLTIENRYLPVRAFHGSAAGARGNHRAGRAGFRPKIQDGDIPDDFGGAGDRAR